MSMPAARFWRFVEKHPSGCWLWSGSRTRGYGNFFAGGKCRRAHRWLYEQTVACILPGYQLDHLCRERSCVNPDHLDIVTSRENTLRGTGPTAARSRQTHCVHGHELAGSNLITLKHGGRRCKTCHHRAAHKSRKRVVDVDAWIERTKGTAA